MEADRLNSPHTSAILLEVLGSQLQFSQDPNSKHHGTTVWDASMVFVKFLEKNRRKGRFSPSKLEGKRVIELGAGCGVAGFGMAMLGCDVISTDQVEVLPLLMRNIERNTSRIMQMNPDSFGSIKVAELSWGVEGHIKAVDPPFDYIIGTDVVYAEHLLDPLLQTILALSGPKTTVLLGYEIRSTNVHEKMLDAWKCHFDVKTIARAKMDAKFQHPSIQLYILSPKTGGARSGLELHSHSQDVENTENENESEEECDSPSAGEKVSTSIGSELLGGDDKLITDNRNLNEWEARRCGAMAARLLRDVKIT